MSLRQLLRRSAALLRDVGGDGDGLAQALRAELAHELSSSSGAHQAASSLGPFALEWDDPRARDVLLRRRHGEPGDEAEEEVVVTAALGPVISAGERALPHHALMKVCVTKPGFGPVLRFDCTVYDPARLRTAEPLPVPSEEEENPGRCDFKIYNAYYYPSMASLNTSRYTGPEFSALDRRLQKALKQYLVARGIGEDFTTELLRHLINKEQGQYISWLRTLEDFVSKDL